MDEASQRRAGVARLFDTLAPVYDQTGVPFFQPIAEPVSVGRTSAAAGAP